MAKLYIKTEKPFVEITVPAKNNPKEFITLGIKAYKESELNKIRKALRSLTNVSKITKLTKDLTELQQDTDLSEEELNERMEVLYAELDILENIQREKLDSFYKSHILFLKKVSIAYEDESGVTHTLNINDTREAEKVDGLWETSDECLAALLDVYFDSPSYRSSLPNKISGCVFDINFEDEKLKN